MDSVTASEKRLKRQIIGKPRRFLAIAPLGFEQTLADELTSICLGNAGRHPEQQSSEGSSPESISFHVVGDGKVEFTAKITDAWKAVAYTRVANRILIHIADFKAENFRDLEKKAAEIPWELYLPAGPVTPDTVSIHVTCKHSRLYHSDAVAERLQKVIEGGSVPLAPADAASATPSAGTPRNAPQNLFVTLIDDRCTLWLDLAGEELYKRGHERFVNDAPLKETIAAAMLFEAISTLHIIHHQSSIINYPLSITLIDPMAGSGTFSLEAAYMASGLIPGKCRDFALKHQPAFKPATWKHIVSSMDSLAPTGLRNDNKKKQVPTDVTPKRDATIVTPKREATIITPKREAQVCPIANIITSDISERAVNIIRHNVECSPGVQVNPQVHDFFTYTAKEIADASPEGSAPVIVLNPPYGKRLDFDAPALYTRIGKKLAELARELEPFGKKLTVAILAPNDDPRPGSKFTCTANLLRECPALDPQRNPSAKHIATSHGGISLNALFVKI